MTRLPFRCIRALTGLSTAILILLPPGAAHAATTTFFTASQVATPVSSGVTSDTIRSEGYVFTYTRDKLFTGGLGPDPIGRPVRVPWPSGVEAQAVTTGPNPGGAQIVIRRADGAPFAIAAFTAKLLANTAATGASFEIMPSLNGEDAFNDPLYFDASGYAGISFPYGPPATAQLAGYDRYTISLFVDFALTALTFLSAGPDPTATAPVVPSATATPIATPTSTGAPTATPASLSPFSCYKVTAQRAPAGQPPFPRFTPRTGDLLEDAFGGDPLAVDVSKARTICSPASVAGAAPPAVLDAAHLEGYAITSSKTTPPQPPFRRSTHTIQNQLGTLALTVTGVASVLVPSAAALGSGGAPPPAGALPDHFACYWVAVAKAPAGQPPLPAFAPTTAAVDDQLGGSVQVTLRKPTKLCLPASLNGGDPDAIGHTGHLVCYAARANAPAPPQPRFTSVVLSTNDEFGDEVLRALKIAEVCLPSARVD